ncbi:hypothetical protein BU23DRAFT_563076 [Bimuria novae-zelandiae CBS 107.79]|uniref:Uncharacterized protein n=1 Tax=Bimuria novae-zelandiae CBS 107.79 TaxID=1447943 RepID=A0A6A5VSW5_9PLEO|nr:hypothetical protein BU23DRAFT_563076 [Bimuria novae-zelandiae CBS 107.79]
MEIDRTLRYGTLEALRFFLVQKLVADRPGPSLVKWLEQVDGTNIKEKILSFKMGVAAEDEESRHETIDNIGAMVSMFAMFCSKIPGYWYTPEDFKVLADAVSREMETIGNTWKFWVVTAQK